MKTMTPIRAPNANRNASMWPTENFFDRLFAWRDEALEDWSPEMDLIERPDAYFVKVEVPGIAPEDIHVTLEGRELAIRGERTREETSEEDHFWVRERCSGTFMRSFNFPRPVQETDIKAEFENGLLTITVMKAKEAMPRNIKVMVH